jgi:cobalt/nickel transport system permease protein
MTLAFDHPPLTDSCLSRLDPRWKLAAVVLSAGVVAFLGTLPASGLALLLALVLAAVARLPPWWYRNRLGAVALFLAPFVLLLPLLEAGPGWEVGPVALSLRGLEVAFLLTFKAAAITTLVLVLLATAPLHLYLQAAQSLLVPGFLLQLVALSYRHVFLLADEIVRLRIALRVRGYRNRASVHSYRTLGHVTGTLLVRSVERAERVGQAMRCRGFDGRFRCLADFQSRTADVTFFLLSAAASALLAALDRYLQAA